MKVTRLVDNCPAYPKNINGLETSASRFYDMNSMCMLQYVDQWVIKVKDNTTESI